MYLRLNVGMKTVKKKQNYWRETKMLPVNKVAKKRVKTGVHVHICISREKKHCCGLCCVSPVGGLSILWNSQRLIIATSFESVSSNDILKWW